MKTSELRYWFLIRNNEVLLTPKDTLPSDRDLLDLRPSFLRHFFLGSLDNKDYACAEISSEEGIPNTLRALPLRNALALFRDNQQYGIAVRAYSVLLWEKNHQFCGRCGSLTQQQTQGFERVCSFCELSFFPRISPSVIVLIKKGEQLLMAKSPHFLHYGLIAGFVEVGESLEEAVHREVKEEVGIEIKNLCYFGSQPWPFPDSLMVAFSADYAGGDIKVDKVEIEEAGWYRYDNLPGRPPIAISIGSRLLDHFISGFTY